MNPFQVVKDLEQAVCDYTGAPFCVTTNSCTMALLLACKYYIDRGYSRKPVTCPSRTYVGVPCSIINAGGMVEFVDFNWYGQYRLSPLPVWDSARMFTSDMYLDKGGEMVCVSFHATKILGDTQGGAILLDNRDAYEWLKRMRFDGRTEGVAPIDDDFTEVGYHCYMSPDVAARLLHKLSVLPKYNKPLPNDNYPDLSQFEVFK
ncbi:MAG: hypothetical protein E6Q24_14850 [Chitinophagaceae bacterium]|nr:MAG: hypothetical protein E6Q24_14850 [Chitinophagaceae bacterium]